MNPYQEIELGEARMSAAQKLSNAWDKQRAKSDASLRRTPSSIPKKEEPKKGVADRVVQMKNNSTYSEGLMDTIKKIGKKVVDTIGHKDDIDLLDDLRKKVTPPPAAKDVLKYPMAHNYVKKDLIKKGVAEGKDPDEYDQEGEMAKGQLRTIIANAKRAHDMLEDDTNMAEWVQSKITLASDYISTVADYMQSQLKEEDIKGVMKTYMDFIIYVLKIMDNKSLKNNYKK